MNGSDVALIILGTPPALALPAIAHLWRRGRQYGESDRLGVMLARQHVPGNPGPGIPAGSVADAYAHRVTVAAAERTAAAMLAPVLDNVVKFEPRKRAA